MSNAATKFPFVFELAPETEYHPVIDALRQYIQDYSALLQGGTDTERVFAWYHPEYQGFYCIRRVSQTVQVFGLKEEIAGTLEAARIYTALGGHQLGAKHLVVIPRGKNEAICSYVMTDDYAEGRAHSVAMDVWVRTEENQWRLLRQHVEQQGTAEDWAILDAQ